MTEIAFVFEMQRSDEKRGRKMDVFDQLKGFDEWPEICEYACKLFNHTEFTVSTWERLWHTLLNAYCAGGEWHSRLEAERKHYPGPYWNDARIRRELAHRTRRAEVVQLLRNAVEERDSNEALKAARADDGDRIPPPDDRASKTLELLQEKSRAGADLVRYLLEQPDRKASLDDIARHVLGAKNVARRLETARKRYDRARRDLDELDAPLRLVIEAKVVSLVVKSTV
jgi:hypothetical protein